MKKKSGQMKLSFGMIFSIILIIIFIAFAFFAIKKFLEIQDAMQIGQFADGLQSDINKLWMGSGSQEVKAEYFLPTKVEAVCFVDDERENMVFRPRDFIPGKKIKHIDIQNITKGGDFCIDAIKGKIKMTLKIDYEEALVIIIR